MVTSTRIVSLLPSATEIVCAVGARDDLVGVSHECDFPVGVERLPVLTRPRRELPRRSGEIDRAVRQILEDALAVYEIDVELLRSLAPDVIVTQDLCDVCAVSLDEVQRALCELTRVDTIVVSLRSMRLPDIWDDVQRVGDALGRSEFARSVVEDLEDRCSVIAQRAAAMAERPSVLTIEWLDPIMVGGTWMPELVELAGGQALVTTPGQLAPTLGTAELEALDPEVVVVKPCGFDLRRTREEVDLLAKNLPWETWRAVREGRVFAADGNAYFNRPGPRLVESLEILTACLHPAAFQDLAERHAGSFLRVSRGLDFVPVASAGEH